MTEEIILLRMLFDNLAARSKDSASLDRLAFLQLFNLPGLLGERLFEKFDFKNTGYVDFEEFLCGIGTVIRGEENEDAEYLFSLYDLG